MDEKNNLITRRGSDGQKRIQTGIADLLYALFFPGLPSLLWITPFRCDSGVIAAAGRIAKVLPWPKAERLTSSRLWRYRASLRQSVSA